MTNFSSPLQLCAIAQLWLCLQLSDVHKYKLCWLVCAINLYVSCLLYIKFYLVCACLCIFLFVLSFYDPGPHGNGRYSEHMLPEVEKKDFRKGAQVCSLIWCKVARLWIWFKKCCDLLLSLSYFCYFCYLATFFVLSISLLQRG